MPRTEAKYTVAGVSLSDIRNRNETRVAKALRDALEHFNSPLAPETIMDMYALALNELPPRYAQTGSIVLNDPVRETAVKDAVQKAIDRVLAHPKKP